MNRYKNIQKILATTSPTYGEIYDNDLLSVVNVEYLDVLLSNADPIINSELHVYHFENLLYSKYNCKFDINSDSKYVGINVKEILLDASIISGTYKIIINFNIPLFGNINDKKLYVSDYSPDRSELEISSYKKDISSIFLVLSEYKNSGMLNNVILNFGNNNIYSILNYYQVNDKLYIKINGNLDDNLDIKSTCYIGLDISDSYVDNISIIRESVKDNYNKLKPANFLMDADLMDTSSTIYKSWEDLLTSDAYTTQNILDKLLNIDSTITLNIDFTKFENFILYSSATYRVEVFKEKINLIELYNSKIDELAIVDNSYMVSDIDIYKEYIRTIQNSFDLFERWLYYHDHEDLFTHDKKGTITPWPKDITSGSLELKSSSNNEVVSWYNGLISAADSYDRLNNKSLWWTIPEHILMDENNSQYVLFVQMVAHHFDNIWIYINALTSIHEKDEHLERGAPNALLYNIAKSFGWKLQNTRSMSDLWLYKEGTDINGEPIDITIHENQNYQIWKRLVNNLPYLLKTKGTASSVKALMSIYGIPNTLISIKEYGGVGIDDMKPMMVEDRYHYKLNAIANKYVSTQLDVMTCDYNGWASHQCETSEPVNLNMDFKKGFLNWSIETDAELTIDIQNTPYPIISLTGGGEIDLTYTTTILGRSLDLIDTCTYKLIFEVVNSKNYGIKFSHGTGSEVDIFDGNYMNTTFVDGVEYGMIEFTALSENPINLSFVNYNYPDETSFIEFSLIGLERIVEYARFPDTYEFRFQLNSDNSDVYDLIPICSIFVDGNVGLVIGVKRILNDLGESEYGNLFVTNAYDSNIISLSDVKLPYFNDQMWTIRLTKSVPSVDTDGYNLRVDIASSSDCLYGAIKHDYLTNFDHKDFEYVFDIAYEHILYLGKPLNPVPINWGYFDGYIQGYKEYFGVYSLDTFFEHVQNPAQYSVDDFKNTKGSLYKYFPLGLDLQRFRHDAGYDELTSSHPDRDIIPSNMILYDFTEDQAENYINDSETYYINIPKIGGSTPQSKKVRIDDVLSISKLSPDKLSTISRYDYSESDSNKLVIAFSTADYVNFDIYNHMGISNLDDYIADPNSEFSSNYNALHTLRSRYFDKYVQRNDINSLIRLLSVYDYSFFDQLKQLIPAKINLISGILIEPHILERSKLQFTKPLKIESNLYEPVYNLNIWNKFADINWLETDIDVDILSNMIYNSIKGDIVLENELEFIYQYLKGVIEIPAVFKFDVNIIKAIIDNRFRILSSDVILSRIFTGIASIKNQFIGIDGTFETIIDEPRKRCNYKIKNYIFSPYTTMTNYLSNLNYLNVVNSDIGIINELEEDVSVTLNSKQVNLQNTHGRYEKYILLPKDYVLSVSGYNLNPGLYELLIHVVFPTNGILHLIIMSGETEIYSTDIQYVGINQNESHMIIPKHINLNITDILSDYTISIMSDDNDVYVYSIELYDYLNTYEKELKLFINKDNKIYDSILYESASYQINERYHENNKRFAGTKLTGPAININSVNTIDKKPVIEFHEFDYNTLKVDDIEGDKFVVE